MRNDSDWNCNKTAFWGIGDSRIQMVFPVKEDTKTVNVNEGMKPIIGISVGDPSGIGPEITAKTLSQAEIYEICYPLVVSDFDDYFCYDDPGAFNHT